MEASTRREKAAVALAFLIALLPAAVATWPPLMDFPNHLARIWLLAGGAYVPPLSEIYQVDYAKAYGNLGLDLAAAALVRALPVAQVGQILAGLMTVGPALGGLALNFRLTGRLHAGQLALLAVAWSTTAIAGFIGFQVSLAAALALAAIRPKRALLFDVLACALLLSLHPLGVSFYVLIGAALSFGAEWRIASRIGAVARATARLAAAAAVPILARRLLLAPVPGASGEGPVWGDVHNIVDPVHILTILFSPVLSYDLAADLMAALPVAALIALALGRGWLRLHAGLELAAAALWIVSPVLPDAYGDGSWLAHRFPLQAALLFGAALRPGVEARARVKLAYALGLVVAGRAVWMASVWMSQQSDVADLAAALESVAPGASVITLQQEPRDWRQAPTGRFMIGSPNGMRATRRHMAGFVVVTRQAFVPTLFAVPGQHPLGLAPGWRLPAVTASAIPYPRQLGEISSSDPYLEDWRGFDYVLVLNADLSSASTFSPQVLAGLESIADRGFAHLYRVKAPALSSPNK
jgi:hypothetical protein